MKKMENYHQTLLAYSSARCGKKSGVHEKLKKIEVKTLSDSTELCYC
jgi:hypothetical protein